MRSTSSSTRGFTVLTGETGAGKSILLDALGLLLGDRFEQGQLRPGADRAELAAVFDVATARDAASAGLRTPSSIRAPGAVAPRAGCAGPQPCVDQRAGPATLAQLAALGAALLDLHGQHAHQALSGRRSAARSCSTQFGGHSSDTGIAGRGMRGARGATPSSDATRPRLPPRQPPPSAMCLAERQRELSKRWRSAANEWADLTAAQRRLANAAGPRSRRPRGRSCADRRRRRACATARCSSCKACGRRASTILRSHDVVALLEPAGDPGRRGSARASRLPAARRRRSRRASRASSSACDRRSTIWRAPPDEARRAACARIDATARRLAELDLMRPMPPRLGAARRRRARALSDAAAPR